MRRWLLFAASCLWLAGCGRPPAPVEDRAQPNRAAVPAEDVAPEPAAPGGEPLAGAATPEETPETAAAEGVSAESEATPAGPAVTIEAPAMGEVIAAAAPVEVRLRFATEPSPGALIFVDAGGAARPVAAGASSLVIGALPPGPHVIRAVVLDHGQVSQAAGGLAQVICQVGEGEAVPPGYDPAGPLLTLASPGREVTPGADGEVWLETRVDPVGGESGPTLKWQLDGGEVHARRPGEPGRVSLGQLAPGPHKLLLWLESAAGVPLSNAGFERVVREFTVLAPGGMP